MVNGEEWDTSLREEWDSPIPPLLIMFKESICIVKNAGSFRHRLCNKWLPVGPIFVKS